MEHKPFKINVAENVSVIGEGSFNKTVLLQTRKVRQLAASPTNTYHAGEPRNSETSVRDLGESQWTVTGHTSFFIILT